MKKKIRHPSDGVDWLQYPVTHMVLDGSTARIRIGPVTESFVRTLYEDERIRFLAHMSVGKNRIVGYTLEALQDCRFVSPGGGGLGIFFDTTNRNHTPEMICDDPSAKLHSFKCGETLNYALAVRT